MSEKVKNVSADFKTLSLWERDYQTLYTKKFENRKKYEAPNTKMVLSYLPGTIQQILVKEGQALKKGEPIIIFESMKMMNIVRIPFDGKIKKICIKVGEKIPKSHLMIELA
jgi:biotin carboxyl carrier protein